MAALCSGTWVRFRDWYLGRQGGGCRKMESVFGRWKREEEEGVFVLALLFQVRWKHIAANHGTENNWDTN